MPPDEPIAKPDASRIDSPASDVDQPADMPWILAAILCLIPGLLLADFLRPALFHQGLLDAVNEASSRNEPMLDKLDYLAIGLLVAAIGFVLGAMVLRKRGLLFRLVAVTYCVTLPLALAELFLRVTTQPRLYQPNMTQIEHPRPEVMPGITGESRFTMNALGLRGPEWQEDAYKILCIGGSTTICTYLDDDETWPALLMARLNQNATGRKYWVGNAGKSGHDTDHHIELLRDLPLAARVDCCIVLCGVNDFEHSLRMPRSTREQLAPSRVFEIGGPMSPLTAYFKQTHLYGMFKRLLAKTALRSAMETEDTAGQAYVYRRKERQKATKDYPLPPLDEDMEEYRKNLERIADSCARRNIRLIFVTQPVMWQENIPPNLDRLIWSRPIGRTGKALSAAALAKGMAAFNGTLRQFCAKCRLELVDLAAVLPRDATVFYDDEHFNEEGARRVATEIVAHFPQTNSAIPTGETD